MTDTLAKILAPNAQLEKIAGGFRFTEGPIWNHEEGSLYFSDIPANRIYRWTPEAGAQVFREPSGNSNGLTRDLQGRLLACEHSNRRVSRSGADGSPETLVERYQGKRLNSPNDIVVRSDGSVFFTDPPYGLASENGVLVGQEISFNGVYRLSADGETLALLVDDFDRPNGLAFSPDERRLYIDDTRRMHIRVFDLSPQGDLSNGRIFAEMQPDRPGGPDGMKVDVEGNLYCTGPGGVNIFTPAGTYLGRIETPEVAANLAFGEDDWRTLFITANTSLYRVRLAVAGIPVPTRGGG
jgi:sugar lactone lactonase YvrE